jgi:outer membrane receptor protein involved in Fe transport
MKLKHAIIPFAALLLAALSTAAFAETTAASTESGSADEQSLGEIIVTAEKRSASANDVPMTIAAFTGSQLVNLGVEDAEDLQKIVPGFHFAVGTYGAPVYAIRGIGFNDNSLSSKPSVALSNDEMPLPFPFMAAGAIFDLDRIEVLKGPQGILYGQNSTGGAVNYISAKPTQSFAAGTDLEIGNFDERILSGFVSGPLSSTVQGRVAFSLDQTGPWQKSYTRSDYTGAKDIYKGRIIVDWEPTSEFKAEFTVNGFVDESDTQAAQMIKVTPLVLPPVHVPPGLLDYPTAPNNDRAADWNPGVSYAQDNKLIQTGLRLSYALTPNMDITSVTSYSHYDLYVPLDNDGTSYQDYFTLNEGTVNTLSQELRLSGDVNHSLRWIVGSNFELDRVYEGDHGQVKDNANAYALAPFGGAYFTFANYSVSRDSTTAAFANIDYDLGSALTFHGGARYTKADIAHTGCTADGGDGALSPLFSNFSNYLRSFAGLSPLAAPGVGACVTLGAAPTYIPGTAPGSLDQDNVSWRAGVDYKPASDVLVYANASKGYKSGGYPILSASVASQLTPVVQESVLAYELGIKAKITPTLQLNGAIFYYDYDNKQIFGRVVVPIFGPLDALVNVPKSKIEGAELQAIWLPMRGLTLTASGTYIDSKIEDNFTNYDPFGNTGNFNGEAFPLTPKWQLSADAEYDWSLTDRLTAFAGTNVNYESRTNGGLGDLPILDIDQYALVDLRSGVKTDDGHWRFWAWGRNVTDRYYWNDADHAGNTTIRYAGMPATFGVSASWRY